jgi:UDP-glucose 4-epimerase
MMRILVTGGAGFVGSHTVDPLVAQGHAVLVVDDLSTGNVHNLPSAVEFAELDIGSSAFLDLAKAYGPDAVVHAAAQSSVAMSMAKPLLDATTNVLGGIHVGEAAIAAGCAHFVYLSSGGALYGDPEYLPCDEDHPIRPASPYGLSKWVLEHYLQLSLPPSIPLTVLRLANVYGPRQDPAGGAGVVTAFGSRMIRGDSVTIFGDGEQTRDFIFVGDVARAIELSLHRPASLTLNIGTGVPITINELFRIMATETGYRQSAEHAADRPGDVKRSVLANELARRRLGWVPEIGLQDGLQRTLAHIRSCL